MRKILLTLILFIATSAGAALNCTQGTVITDKNGEEYCISRVGINWFTAFAWCESQGMRFLTVQEICDTATEKWDGNTGNKDNCPKFVGTSNQNHVWAAQRHNQSLAFKVRFDESKVDTYPAERADSSRAICR